MIGFFSNTYFLLTLTFVVFVGARILYRRWGFPLLNPIFVSIIVLMLFIVVTGVPYESYAEGGKMIEFWLKPAVVALGVPLYKQLSTIRRQFLPILVAELAGCVAGLISVVLLAELFGATREVIISLAPKSVTNPIAIEVSRTLGGIPPLTAAVVCAVGIFGAMSGFGMMKMTRVKSPIAQGLSMGTAAHAIGTSSAIERGGLRYGAWSSLGLILNGLLTALLAPTILALLGYE